MKKIAQVVLVLCVVLLFSACTSTEQESISAVHEIDLIFEYDEQPPGPFVPIEINGSKYNALLDTGDYDGGIILSIKETEKLGLEKTGTKRYLRTSGPAEMNIYNVPEMLIGDDLLVYNIICRESRTEAGVTEDHVIIGMQAFKEMYNILISYKQQKIYVWEKNHLLSFLSDWTKMPITDPENLFVSGTVDGEMYTFALDTGAYGIDKDGIHDLSLEKMEVFKQTGKATIPFELTGRKFSSDFRYLESPYRDMIPFDFFLGALYFEHDVFIDFDGAMVYIGE